MLVLFFYTILSLKRLWKIVSEKLKLSPLKDLAISQVFLITGLVLT
jgi:hypothetical protein